MSFGGSNDVLILKHIKAFLHFERFFKLKDLPFVLLSSNLRDYRIYNLADLRYKSELNSVQYISTKKEGEIMKKLLAVLLTIVLLFSFTACGGGNNGNSGTDLKPEFPVEFTDALGQTKTLDAPPTKIISLAPNITEIVYAVGAGDKLIAVSNWCTYPEEAATKEKVGDTLSINIERIIELQPDLVFLSEFSNDVVVTLSQANITVVRFDYKTVDDIYSSIQKIGQLTDKLKEAAALTDKLKADLKALSEKYKNVEKKKVFIDLGNFYSSSKEAVLGNSISLINAENIALDYPEAAPVLSTEVIISANPDVYIFSGPESSFSKPDGFDEITAFKNNAVHFIDYTDPLTDKIMRQGPRFVEGLSELAKMIYPEIN